MDISCTDLIGSDPDIAHIWAEGCQSMNRLSSLDKVRFTKVMLKFWKVIEGQFWEQRLGTDSAGFWRAQSSAALGMYRLPGVQQYFSERRMLYSAEFVEFLGTGKIKHDSATPNRQIEEVSV